METTPSKDLMAQVDYVNKLVAKGFDFNLVVADAFARGMRDIGYKSTATALNELIDNAMQADATNIHVFWPDEAKPTAIVVADDGHGMIPEMLRIAVMWGGTHRENDRAGFGRFGYGLPSASVSIGERFTVYSRTAGAALYKVTVDLDELGRGEYSQGGKIVVPEPVETELLPFVQRYLKKYSKGCLDRGTVVVIERPERLDWKTASKLERHLLETAGVTYRNFLREVAIVVQSKPVESVDPLFLTPGARYYDIDEDRAVALEPLVFEVKNDDGTLGTIKVRYAYMPPTFARVPEHKENIKPGKGANNPRLNVLDENNGLIVLRNGRQIDVVTKRPYLTVNNDDRYWGVELDFPAALDRDFSITTTKQQVILSERMWDLLKQQGILKAISYMRKQYDLATAKLKAAREEKEKKRASEAVMEDTKKYQTRPPAEETPESRADAEEALRREIERRAQASGMPPEQVEGALRADILNRPYRVAEQPLPGAPFYSVDQVGGQKVLTLNTAHRFYRDVYAGPESTTRLRAALEILLFVMGECELDAASERKRFYQAERGAWSTHLEIALDRLNDIEGAKDRPLADLEAEAQAEFERADQFVTVEV